MRVNKPFLHKTVWLDITNTVKGERYRKFKNRLTNVGMVVTLVSLYDTLAKRPHRCYFVFLSTLYREAMMSICSTVDELEFDYSFKVVLDRFFYISFPNNFHLTNLASINDS